MKRAWLLAGIVSFAATPFAASAGGTCHGHGLGPPTSHNTDWAPVITVIITVAPLAGLTTTSLNDPSIVASTDGKPSRATLAELYLRENAAAVQEGLSAGRGAFLDDVAAAFKIRRMNRSRFGRVLRTNRLELLALADPMRLTPERALAFFDVIRALLSGDDALWRALASLRTAGV